MLESLATSVQLNDLTVLHSDNIRYASMNCKAICQYGSLEFRGMRSTVDMDVLSNWVKILLCLKDKAKLYNNPTNVINTMSWAGAEMFAKEMFGDMLSCFPNTDWDRSVIAGIRRAQNVAYAIDWEKAA